MDADVDGLIEAEAGTLSPFALGGEVRRFFERPVALAGAIVTGDAMLAAKAHVR